ncbi:MAG: OmcA/MtrC family decaheme c-type cytochrome [Gammaproteobacteria bacterium]
MSTATQIKATITGVTIPAPPAAAMPVVKFLLLNQVGQPLAGLTASNLGFAVAKLVPSETQLLAVPPQTAAPAPQISSQWQSYIYVTATPAPATAPPALPVTGTKPQPQATVESGTAGAFVDNGDGTYQYTFAKDISKDPAVTYDAALTHRVGLEIRGLAATNSPVYTFQPSTGATTGILENEIVDDKTCKACHMTLAFHGGARTEVQYCVMCHNPSSIEPSSGNSLDFKIMFHKIHMGVNLPSVQPAPGPAGHYYIFGYMNSISDYSKVVFPTGDLRTCYTCHNQADTATPQTVNWQNVPSIEACGSCHDNVNFQTGANHSMANLGNLTDADCATCHGPTATISNGSLKVAAAHVMPIRQWGKQFAYNVKSVSVSTTGSTVTFSVTDPTTPGHVWNVLTDEPFTYCTPNAANNPQNTVTNVGLILGWSTTDYTNTGSSVMSEAQPASTAVFCGNNPAGLPVANGDGTFTSTLPALPAASALPTGFTLSGSAGLLMDGVVAHDFNDGNGPTEIPVTSVVAYAPITDPNAVPRRDVVDVAKCDVCHDQLNGHGGNRIDSVQACTFCHNPNATDIAARAAASPPVTATNAPDGMNEEPIDLKYMIHALHDGNVRAAAGAPYVVYHRGNPNDFRVITPYPGSLNNCLACHLTGTFYPQDPTTSTSLATTINSNGNSVFPTGQVAMTAATAACSACHVTPPAKQHMIQNGGSFTAVKTAASTVVSGETCVVCHGAGAIADVAVVHQLSSFQ